MLKNTKEVNDLIEEKANSLKQDDIEMVEVLKQEVQEIEDEDAEGKVDTQTRMHEGDSRVVVLEEDEA